jgi:hypothetical protein
MLHRSISGNISKMSDVEDVEDVKSKLRLKFSETCYLCRGFMSFHWPYLETLC